MDGERTVVWAHGSGERVEGDGVGEGEEERVVHQVAHGLPRDPDLLEGRRALLLRHVAAEKVQVVFHAVHRGVSDGRPLSLRRPAGDADAVDGGVEHRGRVRIVEAQLALRRACEQRCKARGGEPHGARQVQLNRLEEAEHLAVGLDGDVDRGIGGKPLGKVDLRCHSTALLRERERERRVMLCLEAAHQESCAAPAAVGARPDAPPTVHPTDTEETLCRAQQGHTLCLRKACRRRLRRLRHEAVWPP